MALHVSIVSALLLTMVVPLWWTWRAVRETSLRHTVLWLMIAWAAWCSTPLLYAITGTTLPFRYLAFCLTMCAFVALLGAHRPGMAAWNFVVLALLAVLFLPVLEQPWDSPTWELDGPRSLFLGALLATGVVNYLPTSLWLLALGLGALLGLELIVLAGPVRSSSAPAQGSFISFVWYAAFVVWVQMYLLIKRRRRSSLDKLWLTFRNSYGVIWGTRILEQFNAAAANSGLDQRLTWRGVSIEPATDEARQLELLELLRATLKRFGMGQEIA